jgi:hypothetical protein
MKTRVASHETSLPIRTRHDYQVIAAAVPTWERIIQPIVVLALELFPVIQRRGNLAAIRDIPPLRLFPL